VNTGIARPRMREELRLRLEEMIQKEGLRGQRLASDRVLAAQMNVNRRTLQKALADLEAQGLIERHQGSGTFVRQGTAANRAPGTARLAIIVDRHYESDPKWQYQAEMIRGALAQGRRLKSECSVLSLNCDDQQQRVWDAREMRDFTGFILISMNDRTLVKHLLDLRRGPVILIDRVLQDLPVTMIVDGAFEGMRAVTTHLISLGHRRIAYFYEGDLALANADKFDGYRSALKKKGLALDEKLLACSPELQPEEKYTRRALEKLLGLDDPPTAIVASRDHRALTLIKILEARGLKIGQDISVAGFNDSAIRMGHCDWLTSCRIYPRKFGSTAVRAALEPANRSEGRTIIVPDRLMIRPSTAAPKQLNLSTEDDQPWRLRKNGK
jgi:LacI family transcriptional regulator, galactose operon repressor